MTKVKLKKFFLAHWLVLVLLFVFFLRLPSLFEPFTYGDEGIYLTLGQAVRKGLVLYRDIHDNKPPMLYLLAALTGSFSLYRLILFIWSFATIFIFYKLTRLVFSKNKSGVVVATTAFAILTSIHTFEGNIGNAENFMLLPTLAAFLIILKSLDKMFLKENFVKALFLAGVLLAFAALFKVPAGFDLAAIIIFVLLVAKKKSYHLLITNYFLLLVGFLLPFLLSFIYFANKGALAQYLTAAFFQNIPYLSSWTADKPQVLNLPLPLLSRGFVVLLLVFVLFIFKKRISFVAKLVLVWFSFSLFAALLSSRPYPHYLIQVLPALSLSFGLLFVRSKEKTIPLLLSLVLLFFFFVFRFWHYPNLSYYLNFYQFFAGQKTQEEYFSYFGSQARAIYQTASYLQVHTQKDEKIFIWGNQPSVYALSRRLPVGRYTVAYHIIDFNGYQETIKLLNQSPPRYLIVTGEEKRPFPALTAFIQAYYAPETKINDFQLFHRVVLLD